MDKLTRYDLLDQPAEMVVEPEGEWVKYEDVRARLAAQVEPQPYGSTELTDGIAVAGLPLTKGDQRLVALVLTALGPRHPAMDDLAALLLAARKSVAHPPVQQEQPDTVYPAQPSGEAATGQPSEAARDVIRDLLARHATLIEEGNEHAYFELAYTRQTGWMAWLTDKPARGEPGTPEYASSRKVIARGQGDTPDEACADAIFAMQQSSTPAQGDGSLFWCHEQSHDRPRCATQCVECADDGEMPGDASGVPAAPALHGCTYPNCAGEPKDDGHGCCACPTGVKGLDDGR